MPFVPGGSTPVQPFKFFTEPSASPPARTYYVDSSIGSDSNSGLSPASAWQTVTKVNAQTWTVPGTQVLFQGGQSFTGPLTPANGLTTANPLVFGSFGTGNATIAGGSGAGFLAQNMGGITVQDLIFTGTNTTTNTANGVQFDNSQAGNTTLFGISVLRCTVSGFGINGILVSGSTGTSGFSGVLIDGCTVHDCTGNYSGGNGSSGIYVASAPGYGLLLNGRASHYNVTVQNCLAYNHAGKAGATNWVGSGITVTQSNNVLIQFCAAHDNGANGNFASGGPVGIWVADATNCTIQFCESYSNKTGSTADGDGFDLDGGLQNAVIQYCYSHDNVGAGYQLYTYDDSTILQDTNKVIRFCISQNDSATIGGSISLGNDSTRAQASEIYNNTVYASAGRGLLALGGAHISTNTGRIANNIFYSTSNVPLIVNFENDGNPSSLVVVGNDYYNTGTFSIRWNSTTYTTFASWQTATGQEKIATVDVHLAVDPRFAAPGTGPTGVGGYNPGSLQQSYMPGSGSPVLGAGQNLNSLYSIVTGTVDFFGAPVPTSGGLYAVGASDLGTLSGRHPKPIDSILSAWVPPPFTVLEAAQTSQGVEADNPPFSVASSLDNLQVILGTWPQQPVTQQLFKAQTSQGVEVDRPTTNNDELDNNQTILAAWVPDMAPYAFISNPRRFMAPFAAPPVVTFVASTDTPMMPVWTWWNAQPDPLPHVPQYLPIPPPSLAQNSAYGEIVRQQDPWQYAFIGAQPFGVKVSAATLQQPAQVNYPGPSVDEITTQPDEWVYTFIGGNQPFEPPSFLVQAISAPPVQPPLSMCGVADFYSVLSAWALADPLPTLPKPLNPALLVVPNPPTSAGLLVDLYNILISWLPSDHGPILGPKLAPPTPPAIFLPSGPQASLDTVLIGWLPTPPVFVAGAITALGVEVDQPPTSIAALCDLHSILNAWIPPDPAPLTNAKRPQGTPVSAPPPYSAVDFYSVLVAWIPPPPQPIVNQQLNPAFEAVAANNPPFAGTARATQSAIVASWAPGDPAIQTQRFAPQVAPIVSFVPAPAQHLAELVAWQPVFQLPTLPPNLNPAFEAVAVNNPPFGIPPKWLDVVEAAWIPPPPQAPVGTKLNPFYSNVPITTPPPYSHATLDVVLEAWIPPPPQPPLPDLLPPSSLAVAVNNPPVAAHKIDAELVSWLPPDPRPYFPRYQVQGFFTPQIVTPHAQAQVDTVLVSWRPPDPAPIVARNNYPSLLSVAVNNPPPSSLCTLDAIIAAWIPPPPAPVVNGNVNATAESVAPSQPFTRLHQAILPAWTPADLLPQRQSFIPQVAAPVLSNRSALLSTLLASWQSQDTALVSRVQVAPLLSAPHMPWTQRLDSILAAWEPALQPQLRRPAVTIGVKVSNPPFGIPPAWQTGVLEAWIPPPPAPVLGNNSNPLVQYIPAFIILLQGSVTKIVLLNGSVNLRQGP